MTSTRPYLIRAFYDWIVDNNCTPHVVVNASFAGVDVPREYVDNGQIVLNVSVSAVQALTLGDEAIEFQARFGGKICKIYAPIGSILAIYAKENGRGMVFAEEETLEEESETGEGVTDQGSQAPALTLAENKSKPKTDDDKSGDGGKTGGDGKGKGRGGHLTLVK